MNFHLDQEIEQDRSGFLGFSMSSFGDTNCAAGVFYDPIIVLLNAVIR